MYDTEVNFFLGVWREGEWNLHRIYKHVHNNQRVK